MKKIQFKLKNSYLITPSVMHFVFSCEDNFEYIPGQFITIYIEKEDKVLKRSYSIASTPRNNKEIEIAASYVENGPGTEYLFNLKKDDVIDVSGPFGRLVLRDEKPGRYFLIGTSTGITPYRAMLSNIENLLETTDIEFYILQGIKNSEHALYPDEFVLMNKKYDNFNFSLHYSREEPKNNNNYENRGYVQDFLKNNILLNPDEDIIYLCGNPNMVNDIFEYAKSKNFIIKNIRREKYIST